MIEKLQPDGVYAIGQPHMFYDIWVWCLSQGCNLYVEKPMGLNLHQATMLTEMAEQHKTITQVSHQRRSSPLLRKVHADAPPRGRSPMPSASFTSGRPNLCGERGTT